MNIIQNLQQMGHPRLLVLGDLILDRYTWGNAERVSPEAPVLVLDADECEFRPGGAASVAALLAGLEAEVWLAGVVGDDNNANTLRQMLCDANINHDLVVSDPTRPTTSKERFMGRAANRHPCQILRVDHESRAAINPQFEVHFEEALREHINSFAAILISDYAKGVCTRALLKSIITLARKANLPVIIDPARIDDYSIYTGATILTPNRVEAARGSKHEITTLDDALAAGRILRERVNLEAALVTLDCDGIALVPTGRGSVIVPTQPRAVYDVTGAGDTVLAIVGLCQSAGLSLKQTAQIANTAAGLQVERHGVTCITRDEIIAELKQQFPEADPGRATPSPASDAGFRSPESTVKSEFESAAFPDHSSLNTKQVTLDRMVELAETYRRANKRIVFTNGCFDLLHVGHVTYLQQASRLGEILIVAVNSDAGVRRLKGPDRPVVNQQHRAALLSALACIDHVLIFDDDTPHELLRRIRPDVLVKGGTYTTDEVVGREIIDAYAGEVIVTGQIPGVSTTDILSSIGGHP